MTQKHIATYAVYGHRVGKRVGTGYLYTVTDIIETARKYQSARAPFHWRWRNDACRRAAMKCIKDRCFSPIACGGFQYCREHNFTVAP